MAEIHGFCDERFRLLGDVFRSNHERGVDEGAALTATLGGEVVVDLWAGTTDHARARPWQRDTLVHLFSTSKAITALTTLVLYDRGQLDLDAPIAEYWPEFAQNGKQAVTCRMVLTHRSGLPGFGCHVSSAEFEDWDHMVGVLERATPWYEPGTESWYHAHTFGFLLGEVVRRISGSPFDEFFRRELAGPAGADFHFGVTEPADVARTAHLWFPDPDATAGPIDPTMLELELTGWASPSRLAALAPSTVALGNAGSIARLAAVLAMNGELDGRRYLSPATVTEATSEQSFLEDRVLGPLRMGLGFGIDSDFFPAPTPNGVHWGGFGGSLFCADPVLGLSIGFTPNRLLPEPDPTARPGGPGRLMELIGTIRRVATALA